MSKDVQTCLIRSGRVRIQKDPWSSQRSSWLQREYGWPKPFQFSDQVKSAYLRIVEELVQWVIDTVTYDEKFDTPWVISLWDNCERFAGGFKKSSKRGIIKRPLFHLLSSLRIRIARLMSLPDLRLQGGAIHSYASKLQNCIFRSQQGTAEV